jgi:predicted amidohydrolase
MVCFDWFFPEAARTLALKGADLIAHPANLVLPYCPEAMRTRCLENRVFAVTCNRVGRERGLRYIGQSQIVDPWGKILSRASGTLEASAAVSVDLRLARSKRLNAANDLFSDRRPAVYA